MCLYLLKKREKLSYKYSTIKSSKGSKCFGVIINHYLKKTLKTNLLYANFVYVQLTCACFWNLSRPENGKQNTISTQLLCQIHLWDKEIWICFPPTFWLRLSFFKLKTKLGEKFVSSIKQYFTNLPYPVIIN